jgi:hypothetical protein
LLLSDPRYYLTHTAKRSQREYASEFFPTTFPNGNIYACSMTMKGCYMGNIINESLSSMLIRASKSLPSKFISIGCDTYKFLSPKGKDKCEICRDQPFLENILNFTNEWIGREYLQIRPDESLNNLLHKIRKKRRPSNFIQIK